MDRFHVSNRFPRAAGVTTVDTPPQGLSGALVIRLRGIGGDLCLRGGAPAETAAHLRYRHAHMRRARADGCDFIPEVFAAADGDTVVVADGRCWELQSWRNGTADFRQRPSVLRVINAFEALARLHLSWRTQRPEFKPCPALQRRVEALSVLEEPLRSWVGSLLASQPAAVRVQVCLRDIHEEHVLFTNDAVTGVIDYASLGADSPAADLGRLMGDMLGDDVTYRQIAVDAYSRIAPLSEQERQLADVLDRTGSRIALARWERVAGKRRLTDREEVRRRLLRARVAGWK